MSDQRTLFFPGDPVALQNHGHPAGGDVALALGVVFDGAEDEAHFLNAGFDGAGETDLGKDEEGRVFLEFVGDDEVLSGVEEFSGEKAEAAGGEVAGEDVDPGRAGFRGEIEPHGVGKIDAGMDAAVGGFALRLGVEPGDDLLDAFDFVVG